MLIARLIGAAAALASADDAGRRELIKLAATAHITILPVGFGIDSGVAPDELRVHGRTSKLHSRTGVQPLFCDQYLHREHKLATADAIVYATALHQGAELLACDSHFEGLPDVALFAKTPKGIVEGFARCPKSIFMVAVMWASLGSAPGELSYPSSGVGNSTHLAGELFAAMAGVNLVHVPYKGTGPGLIAGRVGGQFVVKRPSGFENNPWQCCRHA